MSRGSLPTGREAQDLQGLCALVSFSCGLKPRHQKKEKDKRSLPKQKKPKQQAGAPHEDLPGVMLHKHASLDEIRPPLEQHGAVAHLSRSIYTQINQTVMSLTFIYNK